MTERPLSISTHPAASSYAAFNPTPFPSAIDALGITESVDEEPYTIKCICDYSDDDGNTIFCEACDTWQHIECYYPGRVADASREEFDHSCVDCKPRSLDGRHATERQRSQRQNKAINDNGDKKTKRPLPKSHKKKKPSEVQVNGVSDHDSYKNGGPQEVPSQKKKGHRSNQSVSSQLKRTPPISRPPSHVHPPSPAHTPPDLPHTSPLHLHSETFPTLYKNEDTFRNTDVNSHATLPVTNTLATWLRDPQRLKDDTNVVPEDVFRKVLADFDLSKITWPDLRVDERKVVVNNMTMPVRCLIALSGVNEDKPIGELNGHVGFQRVYTQVPENGYAETSHPRPFVFFHPALPIYIDTRHEGSICRYVRRSCRPNSFLETYINGADYHFWFVSSRKISAHEPITLPWNFNFPNANAPRLMQLLHLDPESNSSCERSEITDDEYNVLSESVGRVLGDHGGCACDLGNDCAFARFYREYPGKSYAHPNGVKPKKGRKPKQSHVSPTSTGHATNSRAASEGQADLDDEDDRRSGSGSTRSKPNSRDLTPLHGVPETNGILTEPTDREKRKIAKVEDAFKKMENPPKKKKRISDTSKDTPTTPLPASKPRQKSNAVRPSLPHSHLNTNGSRSRQYVDVGTSGRQSASPLSAISPAAFAAPSRQGSLPSRSRQASAVPSNNYVDSATQTEPDEDAWYKQSPSPTQKRSIVPLSKRLLRNRHRLKLERDEQQSASKEASLQPSPTTSMDLDPLKSAELNEPESPLEGRKPSTSSTTATEVAASTDVTMTDAPAITITASIKPSPPPWPGQSEIATNGHTPVDRKSPDLRVQPPSFTTPNMSGPLSGSATPSSAAGSIAQSPFGTVHSFPPPTPNGQGQHPSPVKTTKKMSLSDYAKRKKPDTNKASAGSSPTMATAILKPSLSTLEEAKEAGGLEGTAIVESPGVDKKSDPMDTPMPDVEATPTNNQPSAHQPNGIL